MRVNIISLLFIIVISCCFVLNVYTKEIQPTTTTAATTISTTAASSLSVFSQDNSVIDDCCCKISMIENANNDINTLLNTIVKTRFFKYFRVNLFAECPFWVVTALCGMEGCGVCECDDNEIPLPWKIEDSSSDRVDLSPPPPGFTKWKDQKEDMWVIPYGSDSDTSYVNLADTPEANSGYDGSSVWRSIYNENCFTRPLEQMCFEERVFYKLISGLHSSITTHIAQYYQLDKSTGEWKSNPSLFRMRFENHPDRLDNLYFTFLFVLRAVGKIEGFLTNYQFHTGKEIEDRETYELVQQLVKSKVLCAPSFDETLLFKDTYDKQNLITQFKGHFQNISSILNCVTCEKCKLYGKLQTLGLGTALKILFDEDQQSLQRNEIIALINTLRQLSNSIKAINVLSADVEFNYHNHLNPQKQPKKPTTTESSTSNKKKNDSNSAGGFKYILESIENSNLYKKIQQFINDNNITKHQIIALGSVTILSILLILNPLPNQPKRKKGKKKDDSLKKQNQNNNNNNNSDREQQKQQSPSPPKNDIKSRIKNINNNNNNNKSK